MFGKKQDDTNSVHSLKRFLKQKDNKLFYILKFEKITKV